MFWGLTQTVVVFTVLLLQLLHPHCINHWRKRHHQWLWPFNTAKGWTHSSSPWLTLQCAEPLVGKVLVGLKSFNPGLEELLLLLQLFNLQLQLFFLGSSSLSQLLLTTFCSLRGGGLNGGSRAAIHLSIWIKTKPWSCGSALGSPPRQRCICRPTPSAHPDFSPLPPSGECTHLRCYWGSAREGFKKKKKTENNKK